MYCIEESTCDIVWTFQRPSVIRRPGHCAPLVAPLPTPCFCSTGLLEGGRPFVEATFIPNCNYSFFLPSRRQMASRLAINSVRATSSNCSSPPDVIRAGPAPCGAQSSRPSPSSGSKGSSRVDDNSSSAVRERFSACDRATLLACASKIVRRKLVSSFTFGPVDPPEWAQLLRPALPKSCRDVVRTPARSFHCSAPRTRTGPETAGGGPAAGERSGGGGAIRRKSSLSHVDADGKASMVDVSGKPVTSRTAVASGKVYVSAETFRAIERNAVAKGDVLAVAKLAGVMAAKRCSWLIPLCHDVALTKIDVRLTLNARDRCVDVRASVRCADRTGVEMEALTAVAVAGLTVYDMCKAIDRQTVIGDIRLVSKEGGASGDYKANGA